MIFLGFFFLEGFRYTCFIPEFARWNFTCLKFKVDTFKMAAVCSEKYIYIYIEREREREFPVINGIKARM